MSSKAGRAGKIPVASGVDLWLEIISSEDEDRDGPNKKTEVVYQRRRKPRKTAPDGASREIDVNGRNRVSFVAATKRDSWNRSLSTRGRTSITVGPLQNEAVKDQPKRKGKPPRPKGKSELPNFKKEVEYFEEVDAFELLEESPSPKNTMTWAMGNLEDPVNLPHISSRLEKWLISKKLNFSCGPSSTLSNILETSASPLEPISIIDLDSSVIETPEKSTGTAGPLNHPEIVSNILETSASPLEPISIIDLDSSVIETPEKSTGTAEPLNHPEIVSNILETSASPLEPISIIDLDSSVIETPEKSTGTAEPLNHPEIVCDEACEELESAVRNLSLTGPSTELDDDHATLLKACGQSAPCQLLDVLSKYCEPEKILKIGEGTYGEAFLAGNTVCKIVPVDGDQLVNGEIQKKSEELLEEAVLSQILNQLRDSGDSIANGCATFIETLDLKVCQGRYDAALITAWERWDEKHQSLNDHPNEFPEEQRYVVFVLQHGGQDLESFVLKSFDEARSLLVQVTAGLAVAETAYEFEHRDLHWGNILLSRNDSVTLKFILNGKQLFAKTFGLSISIIDFTLSRIKAGNKILFLDLSLDPGLFEGPKGDIQFETYRRMKEATGDCWDGSYPVTNVLWLKYLVDIILHKKTFPRSSKNERELRALKKRLEQCQSAREAIVDPFFNDLLMDDAL